MHKRERKQLDEADKAKLQVIIKDNAPKLLNKKKGGRLSVAMAERLLHAMAYSLLGEQTRISKAEYARVMRCGKPDALRTRLDRAKGDVNIISYKTTLEREMRREGILV